MDLPPIKYKVLEIPTNFHTIQILQASFIQHPSIHPSIGRASQLLASYLTHWRRLPFLVSSSKYSSCGRLS